MLKKPKSLERLGDAENDHKDWLDSDEYLDSNYEEYVKERNTGIVVIGAWQANRKITR